MTTGREALAEAARQEAARVYGSTRREAPEPAVTADEFDAVIDRRRAVHNVVPIRSEESA